MKSAIVPLTLAFILLSFTSTRAAVPQVMNYQGRVAVNGTNYHGSGSFKFALVSGGGGTYWSNDGTPGGEPTNAVSLTVTRGLFSLGLGDTNLVNMVALPSSIFTNAAVYVRVWFNDGGGFQQLSPDQRVSSVGYAMRADDLATAIAATKIIGTAATLTGDQAFDGSIRITQGTPVSIGHVDNGGTARDVYVSDGYAYLANDADGLRIYDITDPANPTNVANISDGDTALGIHVSGAYAYLANRDDGLRIYDISDPANPTNIAQIDNGGRAYDVYVSGQHAYLANDSDGLRIYDVSDPANPINIANVDNGGYADSIYVYGAYAYLANWSDGLRIYDISDPANPTNIAHINSGAEAAGIHVHGSHAYLANSLGGLRIYNVSDPANPTNVAHIDDGGSADDIHVFGSYACLANGSDGLRLYDISDPTSPASLGVIDDGATADSVFVVGNHAYLANAGDGLRVYRLNGLSTPGAHVGALAADTVRVLNDVTVAGNIDVAGGLTVSRGFSAHGNSSVNGDVSVIGGLSVGGAFSVDGALSVNGKISGVQSPAAGTDAANKAYADSVVGASTTVVAVTAHAAKILLGGTGVDILPLGPYVEFEPNTTGNVEIQIPITLPIVQNGIPRKLQSFEILYVVDNAASYIDTVLVGQNNGSGGTSQLILDVTARSNTTWTSYQVVDPTPNTVNNAACMSVVMKFANTGSAHSIKIGSIELTLVP